MNAPAAVSTRRGRWQAFLTLFSLGFKADPLRTFVVLFPLLPLMGAVFSLTGRALIDAVPSNDRTQIGVAAAVWIVAWCLAVLLGFSQLRVRMRVNESIGLELDRRLIGLSTSIDDIEHFETPEQLDRLELLRTDRFALQDAMGGLGRTIEALMFVVFSGALLAVVHPLLAVFAVLGSLPSAYAGGPATLMVDAAAARQAERSRRALHLFDVATMTEPSKEIRVFGLQHEILTRYGSEWRAADAAILRADVRATVLRFSAVLFTAVGYAAALGWLVHLVRRNEVTAGDGFLVIGVATRLVDTIGRSQFAFGMFRKARAAAEKFVGFESYAKSRERKIDGPVKPPLSLASGLTVTDLTYRYPGAVEPAIDGISLEVPPGSIVALVGENGAGKSTLVKLLLGMYRPERGAIRLDDVDSAAVPAEEWRLRASACFQEYGRFELTAGKVVGIGDLPRSDDRAAVARAVGRAAAGDVIAGLPDSYATQLGRTFKGAELSGGQWQKLALGRAMMREAPLLLALDEPTSALDPLAEYELFERYATAARDVARRSGGITVLVSHRFSTVRMADLIVVLDGGRVREIGSHDELMAAGGLYSELYSLQAEQYQ